MREYILKYFILCSGDIPAFVYVGFLVVFFVGSILLFAFLGGRKGLVWSTRLLLLEYLLWIIGLTVIFRNLMPTRAIHLIPFSNYRNLPGSLDRLVEVISNVAVFVPVGFLLGCAFGRLRWWKVLLIGGGFSLLIEVMQFVLKRGFAEVDEVVHNVLGCLVGYGVFRGLAWVVKRMKYQSVL